MTPGHPSLRWSRSAAHATVCLVPRGSGGSSPLAGSAAAMVVFSLALRTQLRAGAVPTESSVLEAITDMPFET